MDIESAMRDKLTEDWDVDFSDSATTPWSNVHSHDGCMSMFAMQLSEGHRGPDIRVYRAFPMGDGVAVSVDLDINAKAFSAKDRSTFVYDNGERGDFSEWRDAIKDETGGDVVLVWANDDDPLLSFVARTVNVGGEERVICGQCEKTPAGINVQIDLDQPTAEFIAPPVKSTAPTYA